MAGIRIRVGAALDRSTLAAFQPIIDAARRAQAAIKADQSAAAREERARARDTERAARRAAQEQVRASKEATREQARAAKEAERGARRKAQEEERGLREVERETKRVAKEREKAERDYYRSVVKQSEDARRKQVAINKQVAKDETRVAEERAALRDRVVTGAGRGIYRGARAAGRAAFGLARDLSRAAGVETDIGTLAQRNVDLETNATALSTSAYFQGKGGQAGVRQDPQALIAEARNTANATGTTGGANTVIEATQAFVAKSGDLETARGIMQDLAMLSKAYGANLVDTADAAADVNSALEAQGFKSAPQRMEMVKDIMRTIVAEGKEGAIEIKDFAAQMAKVASASTQFEGGAKSVKQFGALAQWSRQTGGSASATQAATSVQSFMGTFSKGARLDAFQALGIKTQGAGGRIRDPVEIIMDSLRATKGDNRKMGELFADVRARSITKPFETRFNEEYEAGKKSGLKDPEALDAAIESVRKEFEKLANATISEKELQDSFQAAMRTSATQAQLFNNKLQETTAQLQEALFPALVALAPMFLKLAEAAADAITTITGKDPREEAKKKKLAQGAEDILTTQTSGVVHQKTLDKNKESEDALGAEANRLRKQAEENPFAKRSFTDRSISKAIDYADPLGLITGKPGGATADANRRARLEQSTKEGNAADAQRLWEKIHDQNKKLGDAVDAGALRVVVVNPGTGGVGAPAPASQLPTK